MWIFVNEQFFKNTVGFQSHVMISSTIVTLYLRHSFFYHIDLLLYFSKLYVEKKKKLLPQITSNLSMNL